MNEILTFLMGIAVGLVVSMAYKLYFGGK